MSKAAATLPVGMAEIVTLAQRLAAARDAVEDLAGEIIDAQRKALGSRMRRLRRRLAEKAAAEEALSDAIAGRPELFARPRTQAVDGIKFGLRKQKGAIAVSDEAKAIERLRRLFPQRAEAMITVRESLDRNALRKLTAAELARIGVSIDEPGDEVTIAEAPSEFRKLAKILLEDFGFAEAA